MAAKQPRTFAELLSVRRISDNVYITNYPPQPMGDWQSMAFGGCSLGAAVTAAHASVPAGFHAYSVLGHFLGPALVDRPLRCEVRSLRDTRSFGTRQVLVSQEWDGVSRGGDAYQEKTQRLVLSMVADFQIKEPASAMVFSAGPRRKWEGPEQSLSVQEQREKMFREGRITAAQKKNSENGF